MNFIYSCLRFFALFSFCFIAYHIGKIGLLTAAIAFISAMKSDCPYSPRYFFLVAIPPLMCLSALFFSSISLTC